MRSLLCCRQVFDTPPHHLILMNPVAQCLCLAGRRNSPGSHCDLPSLESLWCEFASGRSVWRNIDIQRQKLVTFIEPTRYVDATCLMTNSWFLRNYVVAAQNFEYKISCILDKTTESMFGYIGVLVCDVPRTLRRILTLLTAWRFLCVSVCAVCSHCRWLTDGGTVILHCRTTSTVLAHWPHISRGKSFMGTTRIYLPPICVRPFWLDSMITELQFRPGRRRRCFWSYVSGTWSRI
jgi:hypothetical protein